MALTPVQTKSIVLAALKRREHGTNLRPLKHVKNLLPLLANNPDPPNPPAANPEAPPKK